MLTKDLKMSSILDWQYKSRLYHTHHQQWEEPSWEEVSHVSDLTSYN